MSPSFPLARLLPFVLTLLLASCGCDAGRPQVANQVKAAVTGPAPGTTPSSAAAPVAVPSDPPATSPTSAAAGMPLAAPMPEVQIRTESTPEGMIWVEGQDAKQSTAKRHSWYSDVRKDELSGGDWLSHFHAEPAEAVYEVNIPASGSYHLWLRANPVGAPQMQYRIGEDPWQQVDFSDPVQSSCSTRNVGLTPPTK